MNFDLGEMREPLRRLKWRSGLTRDGMKRQWKDMPEGVYDNLPDGYIFHDEGEVMSYCEHVLRHGVVQALESAEPHGYGQSSTGRSVPVSPVEHGVGSGMDTGYTGGGSVQTGEGRSGTTYGHQEK